MKYVLMFSAQPDLAAAVPADRVQQVYGEVYQWFQTNADSFTDSGAELQGVSTATTVKANGAEPVVVDGPFNEAKEVVGGFSVIDVPDLDAAIALARTFPNLQLPGTAVEIRPVVDHSGM